MRRSDFHFDLPPELIAQQPAPVRSASRLLRLPAAGPPEDRAFTDLPALLRPGDLLVLNDTRVLNARLLGRKASGGKVEILVERLVGERAALAQVRASKTPPVGSELLVAGARLRVEGRDGEFYRLALAGAGTLPELLESAGHVPLPPYIGRPDAAADRERYQTVFAREPGAVAAPTAGLHFDQALLDAVAARGVRTATLTLHVGAGTFQPMRVQELARHRMHAERYVVPPATVRAIAAARAAGGRVVAVGTTVVRALESAAQHGEMSAGAGETRIFITPGHAFRVADALVTNFHLPESTLLMLVCAFGGTERVLAAYRHAVAHRYRFFSYGDAMLLERPPP